MTTNDHVGIAETFAQFGVTADEAASAFLGKKLHSRTVLLVGGPYSGESRTVLIEEGMDRFRIGRDSYQVENIGICGESVTVGILCDDDPPWPASIESTLRQIEEQP